MKIRLLLAVIVLLMVVFVLPAGASITDVTIQPEPQTMNDIISILVSGGSPYNVPLIESTLTMEGNLIELDIDLYEGFLTVATLWSHTKDIGMLPAGVYDLQVNTFFNTYPAFNDTFSSSFEVVPEPATYYVHADGSGDYPTIQGAIDAADDFDEIVLSIGTYTGDGNRDIDFSGKAITVRSTDPNDANIVANTIIDCQGSEAELHRGFYFHSGEEANSVLNGLTITNGYAYGGGGIYCTHSSPTIDNCIIRGNVAPILFDSSWGFTQSGGGIYCSKSNPIISNCQILDNTATANGGGIYSYDGTALVRNCMIIGNQAGFTGGGGGIGLYKDSMFIKNCLIVGNCTDTSIYAGNNGGGINSRRSTSTIANCTVVGNWAEDRGGGIYVSGDSSLLLSNSILWCNDALEGQEIGVWSEAFGPAWLSVSYSDIMNGQQGIYLYGSSTLVWGLGNIVDDPMFVELGGWDDNATPDDTSDDFWGVGDYRLLPVSPCIDGGNPNYVQGPNETDLNGNPRIIGSAVDIGAYEVNPIEASLRILPQVINRQRQMQYIIAYVRLPEDIEPDEINSNEMLRLYPGEVKAIRQRIFGGNRRRRAMRGSVVIAWFDKEQFLDAIADNVKVEADVVGELKSGQYFYATSEIRIVDRKRRRELRR